MNQPQGFVSRSHLEYVCHLRKALYGLRQAPRAWYSRFSSFLTQHGFCMSKSDNSFFVRRVSQSITILLIYVDDILVTGNDSVCITFLLDKLHAQFAMRLLWDLNQFLGIQFVKTSSSILLSQQGYVLDLLRKAGMQYCKPCSTPISILKHSPVIEDPLYADPAFYRRLVGAL